MRWGCKSTIGADLRRVLPDALQQKYHDYRFLRFDSLRGKWPRSFTFRIRGPSPSEIVFIKDFARQQLQLFVTPLGNKPAISFTVQKVPHVRLISDLRPTKALVSHLVSSQHELSTPSSPKYPQWTQSCPKRQGYKPSFAWESSGLKKLSSN
jgi:hypothetical protein